MSDLEILPPDTCAANREQVKASLEYALSAIPWKLSTGGESGHRLRLEQESRRSIAAEAIIKHLELSGYRFGKGPGSKWHGTPAHNKVR